MLRDAGETAVHQVNGLNLKFTGISTWKAYLSKDGDAIATIPVTWTNQVTFDETTRRVETIVVWFRNRPLAEEWVKEAEGMVAVAERKLVNGKEKFSKFVSIAKVRPLEIGERDTSVSPNATPVTARFIEMVTRETL